MAKQFAFPKIEATKKSGREHDVKVTVQVTENGAPVVNKPVTRAINQGGQRSPKMTNGSGFVEFTFPTRDKRVKITVECEGEQGSVDIVVKDHLAAAPAPPNPPAAAPGAPAPAAPAPPNAPAPAPPNAPAPAPPNAPAPAPPNPPAAAPGAPAPAAPAPPNAPAPAPAAAPRPAPAPATNQNQLEAVARHDGKGNYKIAARIIEPNGKGVKTTLTIEGEGKLYPVKTNKDGHATFDYPNVVKAGQVIPVRVSAPGVTKVEELKLDRSRTPATPSSQPATLEANVMHDGRGQFSVKVRLTDAQNNGIKASVFLSAENQRHEIKTDQYGEGLFAYTRPIADDEFVAGKVSASGITEQKDVILARFAPGSTDPVNLVLRQYHDGFGNFTIFIRVTDETGNGLVRVVTLNYLDRQYRVRTDDDGQAFWHCPDNIPAGDEVQVTGEVSGILETAKLTLHNRRTLPPLPPKYHWRWWVCTNNGRAVIGLAIMVALWVMCIRTIPDAPILHKPAQKTVAEHNYDEVAKLVNAARSKDTAKLEKEPTFVSQQPSQPSSKDKQPESHGWLYFITFCWTLAAPIYALFSLREEVSEALGEVIEGLRSDESKAGDPLVQKLAAWLNVGPQAEPCVQAAAVPTAPATAPASTAPLTAQQAANEQQQDVREIKQKVSFWEQLKIETMSEIIIAAIPKILSRWFR